MHEYELYIDESYQSDHYYVAGILADRDSSRKLIDDLAELAESYRHRNSLSVAPEFHGHSIMNALEDWGFLAGKFGASISIYQRVLHTIQNSGVEIYIEGVDVKRLNRRYRYPDTPYEVVLRHLLERINEVCGRTASMCKVYADTLPREDDFKEAIAGFTRVSTPGYRGQKLHCIQGEIEFLDSRSHFGIQAADMSAYIYRRWREGKLDNETSKESKRATKRLMKAIRPAITYDRKWLP